MFIFNLIVLTFTEDDPIWVETFELIFNIILTNCNSILF